MVGRTAKWGLVDCQLRKSRDEHTLSDDPGNSCPPDKKKKKPLETGESSATSGLKLLRIKTKNKLEIYIPLKDIRS